MALKPEQVVRGGGQDIEVMTDLDVKVEGGASDRAGLLAADVRAEFGQKASFVLKGWRRTVDGCTSSTSVVAKSS